MDLDRTYVHFGAGLGPGVRVPPTDPALLSAWRIMFTRDPWARLWSAYVDKFVLPDSWMDLGRSIVRMRYRLSVQEALSLRKQSALERRVADSENSPLAFHVKDKMKCPDDITFSEFLRFVLSNNNAHWRPVSEVCDPCALRPHFLGKMETFGPDSAFIFNTTGLSDVLKLQLTHSTHVLDELQQLTAYHFQHVQRKGFSACLDYLGVARRLWRAFQLNGYIPTDLAFPEPFLESPLRKATRQEAESHVMERVRAAHSASPLGHQEWSALKRRHLVEVYRSVPRELLLRVQQRFSMDFQLFRYDEQPSDLFGE
ncbi:carbohydrate sulfotransferase 11-like [Babylonia areolata]|uniref:carbohydrate sulfotransferase 11-like n=1 Tax=Babylonia areolata TaxID=304850 RepID=UPI003FD46643